MADSFKPRDAAEVEQAIGSALADGKALEIVGHGTKRAIGRAAQWDATLDLSALTGVTLYEPEELVLSARAGTPLAEIEALVAASKQELAFEPMDYAPLLGTAAGAAVAVVLRRRQPPPPPPYPGEEAEDATDTATTVDAEANGRVNQP